MITQQEKMYLRELAKKQMEYAKLPIMTQRERLWYKHNSVKGERPMIVVEMASFAGDMLPQSKCETPLAKMAENQFMMNIINHEMIDDDKVVPDHFDLECDIGVQDFGIDIKVHHSSDGEGRDVAYVYEHPMKSIKDDFHILKPSVFTCDKEKTRKNKAELEDTFGDIIPINITDSRMTWHLMPTMRSIKLLGMEQVFYEMSDNPEEVHRLMRYHTDDLIAFIRWQEHNKLLTMNNRNHYAGSGSFGFTNELETPANGDIKSKNLWGNMNSQESVGISPDMFKDMVYPYYEELAKEFGLVYYGCCEPVNGFWKDCLENLPNLRKISISMWCDEEFMGEALKNRNVIYSRKPAPQFLGVGKEFDEENYRKHIKKTLAATQGCGVEFIFRDVYTLTGDTSKPARAVKILRELLESR